jgi:hypothetical protein
MGAMGRAATIHGFYGRPGVLEGKRERVRRWGPKEEAWPWPKQVVWASLEPLLKQR